MKLASLLISAIFRQAEIVAQRGLRAILPSFRDMALGFSFLLLGVIVFGFTAAFFGLGIFLYLAAAEGSWVQAALWMTSGGLIIGLVLLGIGVSLMRFRKKT